MIRGKNIAQRIEKRTDRLVSTLRASLTASMFSFESKVEAGDMEKRGKRTS
jgi:hypothetical protein